MKIEKVNDHQIRCTLTRDDLAQREIKVSELAYGTDKAKELFREMMQQANLEFGFEAEDIPLMIEAIPINSDCIVLIITKVEDPEELDTRFSNFSPSIEDEDESDDDSSDDDVMGLFKRLQQGDISGFLDNAGSALFGSDSKKVKEKTGSKKANSPVEPDSNSMYEFASIHDITKFAAVVSNNFNIRNTLFKDSADGSYFLMLYRDGLDDDAYDKLCSLLSEYGSQLYISAATDTYLNEHFSVVIKDNAVQTLAKI
ncbi:MAG: adaptor protein MecA [Butyrivibrio sp.]|nr:adaptor protein MecA [Butyrivibrio sp.]